MGKGSRKKRKNRRKIKQLKNRKGKNMVVPENTGYTCGSTTNVSDEWEVELDMVKNCDKAPEKMVVWIMPEAKVKIDALMEKYPNIEWLAYLIGEGVTVKDVWIPGQEVTSTSVDNIVCPEFNNLNTIGVIHSHHGMGNGFSGTDHEWINQNHNISLCIAKTGIAGQVRWSTPCGAMKIINCTVQLKLDVNFDKNAFIKMAENNINKKVYAYQPYNMYSGVFNNKVKVKGKGGKEPFPGSCVSKHATEKKDTDEKTLIDELSELDGTGDYETCGDCIHFLETSDQCTKNWSNVSKDSEICPEFDPGEPRISCGQCKSYIPYKETDELGKCVDNEVSFNDVTSDEAVCVNFEPKEEKETEKETEKKTEKKTPMKKGDEESSCRLCFHYEGENEESDVGKCDNTDVSFNEVSEDMCCDGFLKAEKETGTIQCCGNCHYIDKQEESLGYCTNANTPFRTVNFEQHCNQFRAWKSMEDHECCETCNHIDKGKDDTGHCTSKDTHFHIVNLNQRCGQYEPKKVEPVKECCESCEYVYDKNDIGGHCNNKNIKNFNVKLSHKCVQYKTKKVETVNEKDE